MRSAFGAVFALLLMGSTAAPRDWAAALRADAQAYHDQIVDNHPGIYNKLDPGFIRRNDAGLALALRRAARVHDYGGYLWAMRGYVASFDDGHVALDITQPTELPINWPGFLTGFDGAGKQVVRTRSNDVDLPIGAELSSCDQVPADSLAERNVGTFLGRWTLASQREIHGGQLFLDAGNPYIARPARCRFIVDGRSREATLKWRPLPDADFDAHFAATAPRARPRFGARTLADGTRWYSMPDFEGSPKGAAAKALVPMIAEMKRDRAAVVAAPRILLDLRGNSGGSSDWSRQVAVVLWGQAAVNGVDLRSEGIDWRASTANLATMEQYRSKWRNAPEISPQSKAWADRIAAGMASARAKGEPLWRETIASRPPVPAGEAMAKPAARFFVLTDWGCASACLDAVDLWKALGATQVGQETSADSLYMDIRQVPLPSGFARAVVPMKVYHGRPRGSNVPARPSHFYAGNIQNTASIERWIANLES